jgi:hypothetical protein
VVLATVFTEGAVAAVPFTVLVIVLVVLVRVFVVIGVIETVVQLGAVPAPPEVRTCPAVPALPAVEALPPTLISFVTCREPLTWRFFEGWLYSRLHFLSVHI